jgi:CRP-like cAMP-binding protein
MQGAQIEFKAGNVIFAEGDPGGDLFFLKEGQVEVYREVDGRKISLAVLNPGEVLGIMTCLTREPRLASARAMSDVKALVVKQAGIKTLISTTPQWVHTVIKDFILRIKRMNDVYASAMKDLARQELEGPLLRTATQVAVGLAGIGGLMAPAAGKEPRLVDVDRALGHLSQVLDTPRDAIDQIFAVFLEVGLLKADPGASVKSADLAVLGRLNVFAEFSRMYLRSREAQDRYSVLSERDCAFLIALAEGARATGRRMTGEIKEALPALLGNRPVDEAAMQSLERAAAAGLLQVAKEGTFIVTFVPATVGGWIRSLLAIRKFRVLQQQCAAGPAAGAEAGDSGSAPGSEAPAVDIITEKF